MLKVLFFIETLEVGGAEKVLVNLVNHMDQTRFDITVQTVWPCNASALLAQGIHYKTIYSARNKVNRLRYRLEAEAGLTYRLHIKDEYDIECAYLEMGPTKVLSASTNKRAKKLAWVHCDLTKALSDPVAFAAKTSHWYERYDGVICVSQVVKESFDRVFQNRFDSAVLHNVIDDQVILENALLSPHPEKVKRRFTTLAVGRLAAPKNYLRLLRAHKRLLDEGLPQDLWILGDGPDRGMLEAYIADKQMQDSVWMPGFIENPFPFMREADLLACSSNYEGYSTFVTEGLILGRPIVTTEVSGMRELLGDSEYGMIVGNDDEAFYRGLKKMMTDNSQLGRYAEKAGERGKTFSAEALTRETEKYFEKLAGQ